MSRSIAFIHPTQRKKKTTCKHKIFSSGCERFHQWCDDSFHSAHWTCDLMKSSPPAHSLFVPPAQKHTTSNQVVEQHLCCQVKLIWGLLVHDDNNNNKDQRKEQIIHSYNPQIMRRIRTHKDRIKRRRDKQTHSSPGTPEPLIIMSFPLKLASTSVWQMFPALYSDNRLKNKSICLMLNEY